MSNESFGRCSVAFEVVHESAISTDPCKCSFNNPAFRKNDETFGVKHFVDVDGLFTPTTLCGRNHRGDNRPFSVSQIRRIMKASPIGGDTMFWLPHRHIR